MYLDILILFVIAVIIFLKVRDTVGKEGGNMDAFVGSKNNKQINKQHNDKSVEIVLEDEDYKVKKDEFSKNIINKKFTLNDLNFKEKINDKGIKNILSSNPNFSIDTFKVGVANMFSGCLNAFNKNNTEFLKSNMQENVYKIFLNEISKRKEGEIHFDVIVDFLKIEIVDSKIKKDFVEIVVAFKTERIIYIKDDKDRYIQGHPSENVNVEDKWSFKRNLTEKNQKWVVSST